MQSNSGLFTITYFRSADHGTETLVSRYDLSAEMLVVYRSAPAVALGAARRAQGHMPANGFRIIDRAGLEVLFYKEKIG